MSQVFSVDLVDILYYVQVLHHVIDSLVFGFTFRSFDYDEFLPLGFESLIGEVVLLLGVFERVTIKATLIINHEIIFQVDRRLHIRGIDATNQVLMRPLGELVLMQNIRRHGIALARQSLDLDELIINIVDGVRGLSNIMLLVKRLPDQIFLTFSTLQVLLSIRLKHSNLIVSLFESGNFLCVVYFARFLSITQSFRASRKSPVGLQIVDSFHGALDATVSSLHSHKPVVALGAVDVV